MVKKSFKRMIALFLLVIFSLCATATVFAAPPETAEDYDEVIAIVHTNDVHGHIDVEPYVKGLADQMKASGDYSLVLTVSAGDVYTGGHAVAGYYNGELIPAIEDQVYDVIVPGNNDFPSGIPSNVLLTSLYNNTKTICANVQVKEDTDMAAYATGYTAKMGNEDFAAMYDGVELKEDGTLDFSAKSFGTIAAGTSPWEPTLIIETANGTKLGLFGLTCTYIGQTQGTVNAAKECVAALKEEGVNAIVGIGHTGWMGEGSTDPSQVNDTNSWVVASEVQDMDALIDSHTHSIINDGKGCYVGDNKVLVNQASCFGKCIGIMYLYIKDGKVVDKKAELLQEEDVLKITPDEEVKKTVDAAFARLHEIAGDPVATAPYDLNGGTSFENVGGHVRANETNMGDFLTDILRAAASEKYGQEFAFAFIPGYCVRSSVEAGTEITNIEIASIFGMPFRLGPKTYTADEIISLVKDSLSSVNPSFGAKFMQFSGISVTYTTVLAGGRTTVGTPVQIKVGDTLIYDASKGGRQVDESWSVLGLRNLHPNDNVWEGEEDELICKSIDEVKTLFHDYLATHEAGKDYTFFENKIAPDNRIVEVPLSFNDVAEDAWFHDVVYDIAKVANTKGAALMGGYKDGSGNFGPADPLQRQDFAVILYRLAEEPESESVESGFPDADPAGYYFLGALWAQENKIITGYEDGRFGVGDNITREQVATILYRYAKAVGIDTSAVKGDLSKFKDEKAVSEFAQDALTWANGAGIITGKADGSIDPQGNAARAEIGAMILRYLEYERSLSDDEAK